MDSPTEKAIDSANWATTSQTGFLVRPALPGKRTSSEYLAALVSNPFALPLSLAALLGWIIRQLLFKPKRPDIARIADHQRNAVRPAKVVPVRGEVKKGPSIFSVSLEILFGVGLNLLKNQVKSWSSKINAERKDLTRQSVSPDPPVQAGRSMVDSLPEEDTRKTSYRANGMTKGAVWYLLKTTATQWMNDKCPQLGASLAYFTVFSLAPLILILLAFFGLFFGSEHARDKIIEQLQYLIDPSGIKVIKDIAASAAKPQSGILATAVGIIVGLFGASGVFGQLQEALNTIWGVKAKPGAGIWGFLRARFLSFGMVAGVCFLLLVSLTVESVLRGLSDYLQKLLPGGHVLALMLFLVLDVGMVIALFAMIFRFLPDIKPIGVTFRSALP
jgi:YihY family inner membrane protein